MSGERIPKMLAVVVLVAGMGSGCGPTLSTQVRWQEKAFSEAESKQEKDGLIVENKEIKEVPPSLTTQAQACTQAGALAVDGEQKPVMERVGLATPGTTWYQVSITNRTGHVIRLNTAVIRLFDPANNQAEPLGKDDLESLFLAARPCESSKNAASQIKLIKMLDRNVEILPDTTVTGFLAFKPAQYPMLGTWKLALYEIPVLTDEAGKVTKTTRFEVRFVTKKFVDTYKQDGMFGAKKLESSKEVTE